VGEILLDPFVFFNMLYLTRRQLHLYSLIRSSSHGVTPLVDFDWEPLQELWRDSPRANT